MRALCPHKPALPAKSDSFIKGDVWKRQVVSLINSMQCRVQKILTPDVFYLSLAFTPPRHSRPRESGEHGNPVKTTHSKGMQPNF
ncbi:MAG: hypothetical protein BGO67_04685 [Alphaproteobacteria bacterium 41-28]|nr:MAG: hypothetical protein BGO67_04685 [Alphaproteobacteria bacterium 41-28]